MATRLREFSFRGKSIAQAVFIETGTFEGESLEHARRAGFETLHSIEVLERYHLAALRRFGEFPNVFLHHGASTEVLPRIIDPAKPTTFWLDAHYQGGGRDEQDPHGGECPLLAELAIIYAYDWSPIVLIDDAHMFDHRLPPGFKKEEWPTREQIRQAVPERFGIEEWDGVIWVAGGEW